MIKIPGPVISELKILTHDLTENQRKTLISSAEIMTQIFMRSEEFTETFLFLSKYSGRTRKRALSNALVSAGIEVYQNGNGFKSQRVWKLRTTTYEGCKEVL